MTSTDLVKILIVDDHPANLAVTEAILSHLGHQIVTANSGQAAINYINQQEFAVIIMDVKMPVMDGFETAEQIRQHPTAQNTPIIFMTGNEFDEPQIFHGYELGGVDYLIKPIHPRILQSKVSVFVELYQQQQQLRQQACELERLNQNLQEQIHDSRRMETQLQQLNSNLENLVKERNQKLEKINRILQNKIKASRRLQQEKQKNQQKIRTSELLHRTILHSISDAVFITNDQGEFTFVCPNADVIFGYSVQEVQEINTIQKLLQKDLLEDYDLNDLGEISNLEHSVIDKFGCDHYLLINIKKVAIDQGTILYTCRDITERKQAEINAEKRQCYLNTLVKLQQQLLTITADNIFNPDLLELLGLVTQASRVFVFTIKDENHQKVAYKQGEWCAEGIESTLNNSHFQPLEVEKVFSFAMKQLEKGEAVSGIVSHFPMTERQILEGYGVKSFLALPLRVMGQFYGFIGFDDCQEEKHWDSLDISSLRSAVAAISLTIERITATEALHQSQEKLGNIVNNTSDGLVIVDQAGIVQFINPTAEKLFSLSQEQLLGKTLGFLSGKKGVEVQIHQINGKMVITEMRVTDIVWDNSPASLASFRDITDRKQIEEELENSLRELYTMKYALDQASIVAITDNKGFITYVNDKFCQISQYAAHELIGTKHEPVCSHYHPHEFWQDLWKTISRGQIWRGEIKNKTKDGHFYWVDTTIIPFLDAEGRPEQYLSIRFDITTRKRIETELRENEVKFRQLAESIRDVFFIHDAKTYQVLYVSPGFETIWGLPCETLYQDSNAWIRCLHPDDREKVLEKINREQQGVESSTEYRIVNQKGEIRWIRVRTFPVFDEQQQFDRIVGVAEDITEKTLAIQALWESEHRYATLAKAVPVGIFRTDQDGNCLYVNEKWQSIAGLSLSQALGDGWLQAIYPDDRERVTEKWEQATRKNGLSEVEYRYLHPNGTITWVYGQAIPEINEKRQVIGYVGTVTDISDRKAAEQILKALNEDLELKIAERTKNLAETNQKLRQEILEREKVELALRDSQKELQALFDDQKRIQQAIEASEAQLRGIFDNAAVGIALATLDGRVIKANQAMVEMLGYGMSQLLQMHFIDFTYPDDAALELEVFQELIEGQRDFYQMEKRYLCANRRMMWGHLTVSLIRNSQNEPCFALGIIEDVDERIAAEQEMQKALAKERELNEFKSHFIDIVSHEFRTPLTSILGYTELLVNYQDKFNEEKKKKHLNHIKIAGERMKSLIEDVLCLSRIDAGKLKCNPQPLDIVAFCQELIEELQIGVAKTHHLRFIYQITPSGLTPYLDEKLLRHILTNLITNGVKYSALESVVELSIEWQEQQIIFFVKDQGIGIPFSDQIYLFESFHRAENVGNIQGTGLGLNIVLRYVELHQGNIQFCSMIDQGTTFRVALPITPM